MPMPSEKEEIWRYSPIDTLDLDAYEPAPAGKPELSGVARSFVDHLVADLGPCSAVLVSTPHGFIEVQPATGAGLAVRTLLGPGTAPDEGAADLGRILPVDGDALVTLHEAFVPDAVLVDVDPGASPQGPVVLVHWCEGEASSGLRRALFPRTRVRIGAGARAEVVEVVTGFGQGEGLVVPVSELSVGEEARLAYVSLQTLGDGAWNLGRLAARVEADGSLASFTVGLGADYDRLRTDASVTGTGASTAIRSAYLGTRSDVHDVRTVQDHEAPRTTSELLCKGAVAGSSRSIYSGLIRIRHGAVRSNAMQTNHNLVLDEAAHADSVPNLDIEENDVRCSHASTVGPIDEDQRYYLESRGVPPERAERLIVLGFFDDIVRQAPVPAAVVRLQREVGLRLGAALDRSQGAAGHG